MYDLSLSLGYAEGRDIITACGVSMLMTQQQCELHASRLRKGPTVFTGVIALNSRGAVVFCASGFNTGEVNADRDGIEISAEQAQTLADAGALDVRPQAPDQR